MERLFGYFWLSVRQLRQSPSFAIAAILTLTLGIGTTTAIFSLVNAVLLTPLPFPNPERLVWITQEDHSTGAVVPESLSYPDYFDWRAENHTLSGLASYEANSLTLTGMGQAQQLNGQAVSSNFFEVLGVAPMLGHTFGPREERAGNRAVMLSYGMWQSRFGADRQVTRRSVMINGQLYRVAGVMPQAFNFPLTAESDVDAWVSIAQEAEGSEPAIINRGNDSLRVIGRLRPGANVEEAKADLSIVARRLAIQYPDTNKWYTSAAVTPELKQIVGNMQSALNVLFGAVALLLLIACANVAGLMLARGARRSAELALRGALGASRTEIVRQILAESLLLSLLGGAGGVVLAKAILALVFVFVPAGLPRLSEVSLEPRVLAFALAVAVLTGLLFGMVPALRMSKFDLSAALRERTRTVAGGRGQHRLQSSLVIVEVALSVVLLVGAGLLLRSFVSVLDANPGFDPHGVLTARFSMPESKYSHDQKVQFMHALMPRLAVIPGVRSASAGWPLPMSASYATISLTVEGHPVPKADHPSEALGVTLPGYFNALRIAVVAGRDFTERDTSKSAPVTIISRAFAEKYFPDVNPLGKHLRADEGDGVVPSGVLREIVGVVRDVKQQGLSTDTVPQYYVPWEQAVITSPYLCLRTGGDPATLVRAVRAAAAQVDPQVPLYRVHPLEEYVFQSASKPRFEALLLTSFAVTALLLAAVGLYGLVSYVVQQRVQELALRLAVGAQPGDVLWLVVSRGLGLATIGLVVGLILSTYLTQLLAGLLYAVKPLDLLTFGSTSLLLLLVALLASVAPAYRASQTDPMTTLRGQ